MGFQEERKAIEERFNTLWAGRTLIKYENVRFNQPQSSPWVALTIVNADTFPLTLSGGSEKSVGWIFVQIFDVLDTGVKRARDYADQAAAVFRDVRLDAGPPSYIVCRSPAIVTVGSREGLFQINVKVPFARFSRE